MFKIVPKNHGLPAEAWAHGENDEVFLGGINENDCARLSGMQVRNEYLKTHWTRAEVWQDVTGEMAVSPDGWALTHKSFSMFTHDIRYRFVKVEAYVKPDKGFTACGSMSDFQHQLATWRTTLLRVERKSE